MLRAVLVIAALALEWANLPAILGHEAGGDALAGVLMRHAAASAMLAWCVWDCLPAQARVSRAAGIALLFSFAFFMPVLGLPGIVIAAFFAGRTGWSGVGDTFATVVVPEFAPARNGEGEAAVHLAIKSVRDMAQLPVPRRLKSLLVLQAVPARIAARLLHPMLGDASDDIRLLAYGFLDAKERKIAKEIERELMRLETAHSTGQRLIFLMRLAELYWELAYSGMAQGDHLARVLDQALQYTRQAYVLAPENYEVLFLRGRILREMNRVDEAYQVLRQAIGRGLPESRALPYLAEIQFRRRDYEQVRASLLQMSRLQTAPLISGVIDFWAQGAAPGHGRRAAREHT